MIQVTKMVGTGLVLGGLISMRLGVFFNSEFLLPAAIESYILNIFFILSLISFIIFYFDNLKLSAIDEIKYFQLFSFIGLLFVLIISIYITVNYMDFICYMGDKNKDNVSLHGEYNMTKEGAEKIGNGMNAVGKGINTVGQGLNTVGSNLGLTGAIVGVGTAVASGLAKAPMPPVQRAGFICAGAIVGGAVHVIGSTYNRNAIKQETSNSNCLNNNSSSNTCKFMDDSSLSQLQALLLNIHFWEGCCISLLIIFIIHTIYIFYLKEKKKLNLTSILGVKLINAIEYINKMITLYKKMNVIYITLILVIVILGLFFSIYKHELFNNINGFIAFHNNTYYIDNSNMNKFMDDSLSPLQTLLYCIQVLNSCCITLIVLLTIQIIYKLLLKESIKLNLTSMLGEKFNNALEYYINKMIRLNKKMSVIYIWLGFIIVIFALFFSTFVSYDLYNNNIDNFIAVHINMFGIDNSYMSSVMKSSYLNPLQAILFKFCCISSVCLSLMLILFIQIISKLYLKDSIKLNLTSILGEKLNNNLEYYINKMIRLNGKMRIIYMLLILIIIIFALSYSVSLSEDLLNNLNNYIVQHVNINNESASCKD